ncbi:multicopper oxidase family protein [Chelatococcus sp. SYSU_G07232]|uniref:Multicopper oxidase family protein n=1 Tax=Chelatococcus albus TaxID=3047466 RepID=A0ABT7ABI4_9HYPH|nr:multicopper oxidase family protein [Chelatococcus sp. SYSU_G07232]MDJ1156736.1 multicopper oxidase family protein [Chelatococcus sp. SYSU_G07232]
MPRPTPRLVPSRHPTAVGRRAFCAGLAATLFALPSAGRGEEAATDTAPPAGGPPVAQEPAAAQQDGIRALRAAPASRPIRPDAPRETALWAYDGSVPGPLLRVRRGEEVRLRLKNDLPQPTSLHWHGVRLTNAMDGVGGLTQEAVAPGRDFDIRFTPPDAGTFWYRPLVPAYAAEQTERGLHGLLVVEEEEQPAVARDLALILDDWALDGEGQIRESFRDAAELALAGRLGNWLTVNGRQAPEVLPLAPGGRARLRILNAANARIFTLRFDGLRVQVVAVDGQPTDPFAPARGSLSLVPGGRLDLVVEAPPEAGGKGTILAALGQGLPLLVVEAEGALSPLAGTPLRALAGNSLPDAIDLARATRADLILEGGLDPKTANPTAAAASLPDAARVWRINGVAWADAAARPLVAVKAGTPVVLSLVNRTFFAQALHVHGHHVRLLHPLDDGWEPYWLDTVPVPAGQTVRIAFVADNPGRWMIGSSILERLTGGLAAWFEVG